jgi:hypothetical protein
VSEPHEGSGDKANALNYLGTILQQFLLKSNDYPGGPPKAILGAYDKTDGRRKIEESSLQQVALKSPTYDGNDAEIDSDAKGVGKRSVGIGKTIECEEFRLVIDVRDAE